MEDNSPITSYVTPNNLVESLKDNAFYWWTEGNAVYDMEALIIDGFTPYIYYKRVWLKEQGDISGRSSIKYTN